MPDEVKEGEVTPVEETPQPAEETAKIEETEPPAEEADESSDADYRQKYEQLENEVRQLKEFIRSQRDESDNEPSAAMPKITADVKEFLTEFAEKPQETINNVIETSVKPYKDALREIQQQQAIDFIRTQKDFSEKMYDDLVMIVEGQDKHRWFNFGNQSVKLKDLPPRQKAEAALQIYREQKKQPQNIQPAQKPVTTVKSKATQKQSGKSDELLTADEFAKKYSIKLGTV